MNPADKLTLTGVVVAAAGSCVGMVGIILQTNGYYAFRSLQLFENIFRVTRTLVLQGPAAGRRQLDATVALAEKKGEDRARSLLGLYCVLAGFFLQLLGSLLLIWAVFANQKAAG